MFLFSYLTRYILELSPKDLGNQYRIVEQKETWRLENKGTLLGPLFSSLKPPAPDNLQNLIRKTEHNNSIYPLLTINSVPNVFTLLFLITPKPKLDISSSQFTDVSQGRKSLALLRVSELGLGELELKTVSLIPVCMLFS